jgi:uncharacterized protein YecE (DUF72 family)
MLRIGTSGWQYADWRGAFYPADAPVRRWLEEYARRFPTVEVNNTFYRLPKRETFEQWAARVPDAFCFAVKASRYLTHYRRLRDPAAPVQRLLDAAAGLGDRLGPVLVQLPPDLRADAPLLDAALQEFPRGVRVAVEVRHDSWHSDAVYEVLARHDAALCLWDRLAHHGPLVRTAGWCYVRLHEGTATPHPCYGRTALRSWVDRVHELWADDPDGPDGYVYFNNDRGACAPRNAATFTRFVTGSRVTGGVTRSAGSGHPPRTARS